MARKTRNLGKEELELWNEVRRTTRPMHPESTGRQSAEKPPKKPGKPVTRPLPIHGQPPASRPMTSVTLAPDISEQLGRNLSMDARKFKSMQRGKLKPDARIDLHGMTLDQAHPRLIAFVQKSYSDGRRLILVITGKGKSRDEGGPIPVRHGVLRHQVPHWLNMAPLKSMILQVSQAHARHGGSGAYYVYLRRH